VAEATLGRLLLAPLLRQDAVLNYDDGYWEGDPAVVRRVPLAFESADLSTSSGVPE
jgi:hypothetical protein